MLVLGIESSCDETAAAVVNEKREILGQSLLSQEEHKEQPVHILTILTKSLKAASAKPVSDWKIWMQLPLRRAPDSSAA